MKAITQVWYTTSRRIENMNIGIVKERKNQEYRVSCSDEMVRRLVHDGHRVYVEQDAGIQAGFSNEDYIAAGAILCNQEAVWNQDFIIKVKEPIESEYGFIKEHQTIFTYLHLASDQALLDVLLEKKVSAYAYETLELEDGQLPLLAPMSDIAGRIAYLLGCQGQRKLIGGNGILPMSIPGIMGANLLVLGCGRVGASCADAGMVLGNHVTIFERRTERAQGFNPHLIETCTWIESDEALDEALQKADIIVCAILSVGGKADQLLTKERLATLKPKTVIIDVSIDQGGTIEGLDVVTTHEEPFIEYEGMIVCTIANLPGIYPKTSSKALHLQTSPYIYELVNLPYRERMDHTILNSALNTHEGFTTNKAVADTFGYSFKKV